MKKINLIIYTLVILMIGALVGGTINSWAGGTAARVVFGAYQVGMFYETENSILIQVYSPKKINRFVNLGQNQARIVLE